MPSSRPAPPQRALAQMVEAWLRGDAEALLNWLNALQTQPLSAVGRIWWELSTAAGMVCEPPHVCQGDRALTQTLTFSAPLMTGGAPRRLVNAEQTAHAWMAHARLPLTRARHRLAMRATQIELLAGQHAAPDAAFALLRHHTDAPVDLMRGRPPLFLQSEALPAAIAHEVQTLTPILTDSAAFDTHLRSGLSSPSEPHRDLCWRLLRLS